MSLQNRCLFFGDNLEILKKYIPDNSIDLIYLDPPFNSKRSYNILFNEGLKESESQIRVFEDTWHWTREAQETFDELVTQTNQEISNLMLSLEKFLGHNDVLAYLTMMTIRLIELRSVLKSSGSIYLHCDPTASHYLKIILDTIFGKSNFRNEIIWCYKRYTAASNRYQRLHDVIFFYGKSAKIKYNDIRVPYGEKSGKKDSHYQQDEDGNWFRWQKRKGQEPYKILLSKGVRLGDWWEIPHINASANERLGYPTQKPEALLERIIKASSDEGDWILDPFCGCGTTVAVAERLNREWIGVDISILAIDLIKARLENQFPNLKDKINIDGIPTTVRSAKAFFENDPFQFEIWAVGLVGGMAKDNGAKGADKGIDGVMVLKDADDKGNIIYRKGIIQVKGGKVQRNQVATLKSDVDREKADFGIFITLKKPTRPMKEEAVVAGEFIIKFNKSKYPKIQIVTIEELLSGKKPNLPLGNIEAPLPRAIKSKIEAPRLFKD